CLDAIELLHPPLPPATSLRLERRVAHSRKLGVVHRRGRALCLGRTHLEELRAGGSVGLARLVHAPAHQALEILVGRHRRILLVRPRRRAPQRQRAAASPKAACPSGSLPPFASQGLLPGRSRRGWAWIAARGNDYPTMRRGRQARNRTERNGASSASGGSRKPASLQFPTSRASLVSKLSILNATFPGPCLEVESMTCRQGNGFVVLRPEGDLCEGPESDRVEAALAAWVGQKRCVIVDLSRTRQLAARGLGILVRAHQESMGHGGRIGVCGATALHLWMLRVTCVAKFLAVYKTKAAAVAALSGRTVS